jgi:hypothetical protein
VGSVSSEIAIGAGSLLENSSPRVAGVGRKPILPEHLMRMPPLRRYDLGYNVINIRCQ